MKRSPLILFIGLALLAQACQDRFPDEKGYLSIELGMTLRIHEEESMLKATIPPEEFCLELYMEDSTLLYSWEHYFDLPDTIDLVPGNYFVIAYSDNNVAAAFENPYYLGSSGLFEISAGSHTSVSISCTLANSLVSVSYAESLDASFIDYSTSVSTGSDSLIYERDETRIGYFQPQALSIIVSLSFQDNEGNTLLRKLIGSIPSPLPNHHYIIEVDAALEEGSGTFVIVLDSTGLITETIALTGTVSVEPDPGSANEVFGSLLVTEIMYDPSVLSDTEGEWIEIYNNTDSIINLYGILLLRDGLYGHTIGDSIMLGPAGYYVLARTSYATDAENQYVYGSAISLSNTGAELALHNGGTVAEPGELLWKVDYGQTGFPLSTGHSICLDPAYLNAIDGQLGSSWCVSTSVYSTGDYGTPGTVNDSCQK